MNLYGSLLKIFSLVLATMTIIGRSSCFSSNILSATTASCPQTVTLCEYLEYKTKNHNVNNDDCDLICKNSEVEVTVHL